MMLMSPFGFLRSPRFGWMRDQKSTLPAPVSFWIFGYCHWAKGGNAASKRGHFHQDLPRLQLTEKDSGEKVAFKDETAKPVFEFERLFGVRKIFESSYGTLLTQSGQEHTFLGVLATLSFCAHTKCMIRSFCQFCCSMNSLHSTKRPDKTVHKVGSISTQQ